MALLNILHFPDPRLRTRAQTVKEVDHAVRQLISDMLETMYDAKGIGLAATQVNVHQRVLVVDVSEERNQPLALINPQILQLDGSVESEEGCLSVPEYYDTVKRAERIQVQALDGQGQRLEFEAEGLLAICIQHEIDHLNGKLFVDYLSELKRQRLRKKISKLQRLEAAP